MMLILFAVYGRLSTYNLKSKKKDKNHTPTRSSFTVGKFELYTVNITNFFVIDLKSEMYYWIMM